MNAHIAPPAIDPLVRTARFALTVTLTAALAAWFLAAVVELSEPTVVLTIMTVAFIASWITTATRTSGRRTHRVTVIRAHARTF